MCVCRVKVFTSTVFKRLWHPGSGIRSFGSRDDRCFTCSWGFSAPTQNGWGWGDLEYCKCGRSSYTHRVSSHGSNDDYDATINTSWQYTGKRSSIKLTRSRDGSKMAAIFRRKLFQHFPLIHYRGWNKVDQGVVFVRAGMCMYLNAVLFLFMILAYGQRRNWLYQSSSSSSCYLTLGHLCHYFIPTDPEVKLYLRGQEIAL